MNSRTAAPPNPKARSIFEEGKRLSDTERIYFEFVDRAAADPEDRIISNGEPTHAAYLIYKFFANAQARIRISCGSLRQDLRGVKIYSDPKICDEAVAFLGRGGKLDILVEDGVHVDEGAKAADHPLLAAIAKSGHQTAVTVRKAQSHAPVHFLLMDNDAVRVEGDKEQVQAIANFHDPKLNQLANEVFDDFAKHATETAFSSA